MHVGLDFDNTIVSYDALFHKIARENDWVPDGTPVSKVSVRDHLRRVGRENVWTEMQGIVYGGRMSEADPFPGVLALLGWARASGIRISIVSHKTRYPYLGEQCDLHAAARTWVERSLRDAQGPLVPPANVHFELTKEAKVARIAAIGCELYVDDLPEILLAPEFPRSVERLLFDPDDHYREADLPRASDWSEIRALLAQRWRLNR
jgi:hypothetical protein